MPRDLPADARREWRRLLPILEALGTVGPADSTALADLCLCITRLRAAEQDIGGRGLLVDGDRGKVKNPAVQLARQYRQALMGWSQRFGLDPAARQRLDVQPPAQPDAFDAFLARQQRQRAEMDELLR